MKILRVLRFTLTFIALSGQLRAGEDPTVDSLLRLIPNARQDTTLMRIYLNIGEYYESFDYDKAKAYYYKAVELGQKAGDPRLYGLSVACLTDILNWQEKLDSSLVYNRMAVEMARNAGDSLQYAKSLGNLGNVYNYKGFYETALEHYFKAIRVFERLGEKKIEGQVCNLIVTIYNALDNEDLGIPWGERAVGLLSAWPDDATYCMALLNLSTSYAGTYPPQHDKQLECLLKGLRIAVDNHYLNLEGNANVNLGNYYLQRFTFDDFEKARQYNRRAAEIFSQSGDIVGLCITRRFEAYGELYRNNLQQAEIRIRENLEVAREYDLMQEERKCYGLLGQIEYARHNFFRGEAYHYLEDSVARAILNTTLLSSMQEKEVKYETEKKEMKIASLEQEKILYRWLGFSGAAIAVLIVAFLILRQRMIEQKIARLEQEKQLVATQAVLDGETAERIRLARDLHDGLGGMLSVVKLNLSDMKKGATIEGSDVERFNHALNTLDESIRELRRVAHNMMPDSLSRYGLKPSLTDFCNSIPMVRFQYFGSGDRLDPKLEVMIYRTVYELVNNVLKHADAKKIIVQIVQEVDRIALTVQDDGCGFDITAETPGTGLNNIRNRVGSYNGRMEIWSKPGEGTEISVDFKLPDKGL